MKEHKVLILIERDGRWMDRSRTVVHYQAGEKNYSIKFKGNDEEYQYAKDKVAVFEKGEEIDLTRKMIYRNGIALSNIVKAIRFDKRIKVFFREGHTDLFEEKELLFLENGLDEDADKRYKELLKLANVKVKKEEETKLQKQYKKLNFVHPDSVLSTYLHKKQIKKAKVPKTLVYPFGCNLEQQAAMNQAFANQLSVVEGADGTGKTETVLNILLNLLVYRKKSIVVAGSEMVDLNEIKSKLEEAGCGALIADFRPGEKSRFFQNMLWYKEQAEKNLEDDLDIVMENFRTVEKKLKLLLELDKKRALVRARLQEYEVEKKHFEHYYYDNAVSSIDRIPIHSRSADDILGFLLELEDIEQTKSSVVKNISRIRKMGLRNTRLFNNHQMALFIRLQKDYYTAKINSLRKELGTLEEQLENEEYESLLRLRKKYSREILRIKLKNRYVEREKMHYTEGNYKIQFESFIKSYPVILCSAKELAEHLPDYYLMDYLILEDAQWLDLLSAGIALACAKNLVLTGDSRMEPEIVNRKIKKSLKSYKIEPVYDYFEKNIFVSFLELYKKAMPHQKLSGNYRNHPRIVHCLSNQFYRGSLLSYRNNPRDDQALLLGSNNREIQLRKSNRIVREGCSPAQINKAAASLLNDNFYNDPADSPIGMVTPFYRKKEKVIGFYQEEWFHNTYNYCGDMKEIIFLSAIPDENTKKEKSIRYNDSQLLLSTAIARAEDRFILLADEESVKKNLITQNLYNYMEYQAFGQDLLAEKKMTVFRLFYRDYAAKRKKAAQREGKLLQSDHHTSVEKMLIKVCRQEKNRKYGFISHVYLKNMVRTTKGLSEKEAEFLLQFHKIDFLIYRKTDRRPVLLIDIGDSVNEGSQVNTEQKVIRYNIFEKCNFEYLVLEEDASKWDSQINDYL